MSSCVIPEQAGILALKALWGRRPGGDDEAGQKAISQVGSPGVQRSPIPFHLLAEH